MNNEKRVIKKYPNRRLYDTATSSYITLSDVKQLVLEQVEIQVIDAKWGEFMKFQGPAMQNMMTSYLEQSTNMFVEMQNQMQERAKNLFSGFGFPANYNQPNTENPTNDEKDTNKHKP